MNLHHNCGLIDSSQPKAVIISFELFSVCSSEPFHLQEFGCSRKAEVE